MPISREKKLLKLLYLDEKEWEQTIYHKRMMTMRGSSVMRQSTRETKKTKARDEDSESDYKHLTLRMRKRMFTSLHGVGNFNKMNKDGLNFLFNQIKGDYIEFEILRRPKLTIEDAAFMAALALQVKRYKKILTSKDNALKPEEIRKSLDYSVPYSI